jgi:pimeloyl-ACP methyl ester carboxylesterase/SAM-dependent methyltransferase
MSRNGRQQGTATQQQPKDNKVRERLLAAIPLTQKIRHLNGVSTAVLEGGQGPPIVMLHGAGEFAAVWTRVMPELMKTNYLVIPDLPGQGASETADGNPPDAEGVLEWLDQLIGQTCDSPPVLAGHLLGGAIAARYAADHGHRISHLVLVDTMGLTWYRPSPAFAVPMVSFLARPTAKSRDRFFDRCFLDHDRVGKEIGDSWPALTDYALDRAREKTVQASVRRQMTQLGVRPIPPETLGRIDVPTTLIHGRHDLQVRLKTAEDAAARYGWALHVIEDCRDDPAAEQPAAFVDALRTTLRAHLGKPSSPAKSTTPTGNNYSRSPQMTANPSTQPPVQPPTVQSIRQAWDSIAARFDEFVTPQNLSHGLDAVGRAGVGPGTKFLDVAAGSGALSIPAARLGADVVATDISPAMIARLAARAQSNGLHNLDARVMDGCALDLPDDSFDVAASQHGVSLFPDVGRGISELRRVAKPGGQVVVVAFGPPQKAEFLGFFMGAIHAVAPDLPAPPMDPPPLPFQLADPDVFRSKLSAAGLSEVSVETITWDMQVETAGSLWNFTTSSNPLAAGLNARLADEQRSDVREVLAGMLRERSAGRPFAELHTQINIGIGRK